MALFELKQDYKNDPAAERRTFKDFAASDINTVFFNGNEHADRHNVDGKQALVILEKTDVRDHSAHWENGSKQNFDTGLYNLHMTLYIKVEDYGPKPKQGKLLVLDKTKTYAIRTCDDEGGVYRMTIERVRQS